MDGNPFVVVTTDLTRFDDQWIGSYLPVGDCSTILLCPRPIRRSSQSQENWTTYAGICTRKDGSNSVSCSIRCTRSHIQENGSKRFPRRHTIVEHCSLQSTLMYLCCYNNNKKDSPWMRGHSRFVRVAERQTLESRQHRRDTAQDLCTCQCKLPTWLSGKK